MSEEQCSLHDSTYLSTLIHIVSRSNERMKHVTRMQRDVHPIRTQMCQSTSVPLDDETYYLLPTSYPRNERAAVHTSCSYELHCDERNLAILNAEGCALVRYPSGIAGNVEIAPYNA